MTGTWNVRAVLLDMDGTLLDTERVYFDSLVAALNAHGYTDDVVTLCHAMVGLPGPECEAMLHARYGEDFPLADINKAFIARRDETFEAGVPLKRGTVELLDALQAAEYPMAIVTSSSRRTADAHLRIAGIHDRFQAILTRDDVIRGKPSPDLYLLAASRFGVTPETCVAVEDSNHGVTAGARCRRHHHHGARHGAADGRVARELRGCGARPRRGARHATNKVPARAALDGKCTPSTCDTRFRTKADMHPDAPDVRCSATIDARYGTSDLNNS